MKETEYYWEIVERDGAVTKIPPQHREIVQKRWDEGQPIVTLTHTIPSHQIVKFRMTSERYGEQPLLDAAARAFNEPIINNGGVRSKWVKKIVSQQSELLKIPSYRVIGRENGMVVIAFKMPVHLIDLQKVEECNVSDIALLTR